MSRLLASVLLCASLVPGAAPPLGAAPRPEGDGGQRVDNYGDPLPEGAIARLGTLRLRHVVRDGSGAACVVFSADGKILVSGGDDGPCVWDVATGKELGWFQERSPAPAVRFTADGKTLITADNNGVIRHWEAGTGKLLRKAEPAPDRRASGFQSFLSTDGKLAGVVGHSGEVWLRDADTGAGILQREQAGRGLVPSAALSPDGKILAVSAEGNRALLIDVASNKEVRQLKGPSKAPDLKLSSTRMLLEFVCWFTFSPDGQLLAAVSGRDSVCVWDVASGALRYQINGDRGHVAFSPDGKYLACGSEGTIGLFETSGGKEVRRFERHAGFVYALAFSPDGKSLASAEGYTVTLWDVATGKRRLPFAGHESPVQSLAFSPDGTGLSSGDAEDGTLIVWDLKTRKPHFACTGHFPGVLSVAYSPDGMTLATGDGGRGTGGFDAQIRLWSTADGQLLRQFPGHLNSVQSLAFAPDGRTLASAGHDARAKLWDVATGKRLQQIRGADGQFKSVAFAPDGKMVLVAGSSGELALWQTESGQKLRDVGPAGDERRLVLDAAFLPDGSTVLSREFTNGMPGAHEVRFWDAGNGRLLRSFPLAAADYSNGAGCAFSPDGKILAISGGFRDLTVQLWDTAFAKPLVRLQGHGGGAVSALAFSADGKLLATGARDTTVLLWDVARLRLEHLWSELAGGQDESARALKQLAATPGKAVPYLKEHLRRAADAEGRVRSLVADLDDDAFEVREKASGELERLGPDAAFALHAALDGSPGLEVRNRIQKVLAKMEKPGDGSSALTSRRVGAALALLEEIGTVEAREALEELAKGPEKSTVAREARAAVERLRRRKAP